MSLDNILLPGTILQGLYTKNQYDLETDKLTSDEILTGSIAYLGSNQKKIAVLVSSTTAIYLPDEELNFLLGIITACKLSMADIALINVAKNPNLVHSAVTQQLKAEKIFLFGLDAAALALPLQFPHYQVQHFNNQIYLSSVTLNELQANKEEKLKLWNCLKNIFTLG